MLEQRNGNLIISSIPTQSASDQMIAYLMTIVKNVPKHTLESKFQRLPTTLFKNIEAVRGEKIVEDLKALGVISKFVDPLATMEPVGDPEVDDETIDSVGKLLQELLNRARPSVDGAANKAKSALERYRMTIKSRINDIKDKHR